MPILSATHNTPYRIATPFRPVTTLSGGNVPDYALRFDVLADYDGGTFAFDSGTLQDLVSEELVDRHFLLCRYERLLKYKRPHRRAGYYLVPWMAIPCTGSIPGSLQPATDTFKVKVSLDPHQRVGLFQTNDPTPNLQLVVSSHTPTITATWVNEGTAFFPATANYPLRDFSEHIQITILQGNYPDYGAWIEIQDQTSSPPKTVGKLRIVFLPSLTVKTFPVTINDTGTHFRFTRRAAADMPYSMELSMELTFGGTAPTVRKMISTDANTYGFNQIGVSFNFDSTGVNLYDKNNALIDVEPASNNAFSVPHSPSGQISDLNSYGPLLTEFISEVHLLKELSGNVEAKRSAFSRIFLFFTPFRIMPQEGKFLTGVSRKSPEESGGATKDTVNLRIKAPPNVSLFESIKNWNKWSGGVDHPYEFMTLVHESGHALHVNHFFDDDATEAAYASCYTAHRWLRLYLFNENVTNIRASFVDKKVRIEHLATLFDDIVARGMTTAMKDFIDQQIFFPPSPGRPTQWQHEAIDDMNLAELVIWRSLNDLVKYKLSGGAKNIMDYDNRDYRDTPINGAYVRRVPVRFNRFQWELLRSSAQRMNEIEAIT